MVRLNSAAHDRRITEGGNVAQVSDDGALHVQAERDFSLTPINVEDLYSTQQAILKELKIMNLHLSIMTDNCFTKEEVL